MSSTTTSTSSSSSSTSDPHMKLLAAVKLDKQTYYAPLGSDIKQVHS